MGDNRLSPGLKHVVIRFTTGCRPVYNRLSPRLQPLTIGSVLKIRILFQLGSVIVFSMPVCYFVSTTK
jgi:hypothetical protein